MIRVLVVDDHPLVREGLRQVLAATADIVLAGEAADGEEGLEQIRRQRWDAVLLDLSLPGMSGLELLAELKERAPHPPVLVLSMHAERHTVVHALKAGAAGYMTKDSAALSVVAAIRKVASGGRYVTPSLAETLVGELQQRGERRPHEELSQRELEVVRLIASGSGIKEIAAALALGETTVSTYRSRALEKLGLSGNADLVRYAIESGLLDSAPLYGCRAKTTVRG
jgi:two-component system invasion response regulator UvrY